MLVESMTPREVYTEVYTDLSDLLDRSLERLGMQYDKERRIGNVPREAAYPKVYDIETKKKNKWLVLFAKASSSERYNGDPNISLLTYYYTTRGLVVLKPRQVEGGGFKGLVTYIGHLFTRYNERMNLGLTEPLEKVKHFLIHNGVGFIRAVEKEGVFHAVSITKDGVLLGDFQEQSGAMVLFKTFVSKKELKEDQVELKDEVLASLQTNIEELLNEVEFDQHKYHYYADLISNINNGEARSE